LRTWLLWALAILPIAGALYFVARTALRLRGRHLRVFAARLPDLPAQAGKLIDAPLALYHGARFADGARLLAPDWSQGCVGDLWCTEQALFLQREHGGKLLVFPLAWIVDASLVRKQAPLAGKELPMLRLRFQRGGELLEAELSLPGGTPALEALRREVHLRQGEGSALSALTGLLQKEPVPGAGHK